MKPPETPSTESKTEEFGPGLGWTRKGVHNYLWCNSVKRASRARCRGRIIRQSILFLGGRSTRFRFCGQHFGQAFVVVRSLGITGASSSCLTGSEAKKAGSVCVAVFQEGMGWMPCWIIQFMRSAVRGRTCALNIEEKRQAGRLVDPGLGPWARPLRLCRCSAG